MAAGRFFRARLNFPLPIPLSMWHWLPVRFGNHETRADKGRAIALQTVIAPLSSFRVASKPVMGRMDRWGNEIRGGRQMAESHRACGCRYRPLGHSRGTVYRIALSAGAVGPWSFFLPGCGFDNPQSPVQVFRPPRTTAASSPWEKASSKKSGTPTP